MKLLFPEGTTGHKSHRVIMLTLCFLQGTASPREGGEKCLRPYDPTSLPRTLLNSSPLAGDHSVWDSRQSCVIPWCVLWMCRCIKNVNLGLLTLIRIPRYTYTKHMPVLNSTKQLKFLKWKFYRVRIDPRNHSVNNLSNEWIWGSWRLLVWSANRKGWKKSDRQLIGNYFSSVHMRFISCSCKTQCWNHIHFCFYTGVCKNGRKQIQVGFLAWDSTE